MTTAQGAPPRTLKIVAAITLLLSAIPMAGGIYVLRLALRAPHAVDVSALMDRERTEVGDFVTVRITPSLRRVYEVNRVDRSRDDHLLGAEEDPHLVVYAHADSDLGEQVAARAGAEVLRPQEVSGLIHDYGDYEHLTSEIPGYLVDEHVETAYGWPERMRVLEVGPSRAKFAFIGGASIGTCGLPLIALAIYALVRARKTGRGPARF